MIKVHSYTFRLSFKWSLGFRLWYICANNSYCDAKGKIAHSVLTGLPGPAVSASTPQHVFGEFCLWTFSFSMSETTPGLLFLEWSCDSLDIWKYKRENGCQVFLLQIRWEMKSSLLLGVVCVLIFLIILVIQSLKIWDPFSILSQKETSPSTTYLITQIKCIFKSP